jgi:tRNA threonylcarbamoyl adenosine modification protein YeaZ
VSTIVLGIDTSTDVCCGLAVDGGIVASGLVADRRAHAEQLMPTILDLLDRVGFALADLTGIVVGVGPGPFTGLRVGIVTAQTLGAVLGIEVRGVCSLDAVAAAHVADGEFLAVSDARRKEVYWARYAADGARLAGPFVTAPAELPALPVVGPGAGLVGGEPTLLDGGVLAAAGPTLPDAGLTPLYLRRPDAEVPTRRKSTLLQPRLALGRRDR